MSKKSSDTVFQVALFVAFASFSLSFSLSSLPPFLIFWLRFSPVLDNVVTRRILRLLPAIRFHHAQTVRADTLRSAKDRERRDGKNRRGRQEEEEEEEEEGEEEAGEGEVEEGRSERQHRGEWVWASRLVYSLNSCLFQFPP